MSELTWNDFLDEYQQLEDLDSQKDLQRATWEIEDTEEANILIQNAEKFWKDPICFSNSLNMFFKKKCLVNIQKSKEERIWNQWIPMSTEWKNLNKMYQYRLIGPRWNCFAQIGLMHIKIEKSIQVYVNTLSQNSDAWTVVFYNQKAQTMATFGSKDGLSSKNLELPSGVYTIVYRCYTDDLHLYCPKVVVDQKIQIESMVIKNEKLHNQKQIRKLELNKNPLFFLQQYYVFYWLKNKQPDNGEYLPVGNPDTNFSYGYLSKGKLIQTKISQQLLENFRFYLVTFDHMSIPQQWNQIITQEWTSPPSLKDATYLIRCIPRGVVKYKPNYKISVK